MTSQREPCLAPLASPAGTKLYPAQPLLPSLNHQYQIFPSSSSNTASAHHQPAPSLPPSPHSHTPTMTHAKPTVPGTCGTQTHHTVTMATIPKGQAPGQPSAK
ncbi:hypothetical protein EJ04DRAFT_274434 [Polyplosphaeria fusca]|uniref:Uncharacterized protein n=1 Tax=Polyplosphaeria fusca TaxID=682080 RepID=A0A9P4QYU7_9PLEO|nr:hypothetical protein EJ04DRAFT_274434 [Polyplosphaeria fusca]